MAIGHLADYISASFIKLYGSFALIILIITIVQRTLKPVVSMKIELQSSTFRISADFMESVLTPTDMKRHQ